MYNGGGSYGNGGNEYKNGGSYSTRMNIGGFQIKPIYVYIGAALLFLLVLYLVVRVLNAGLVMHFSLAAGVLLLLANMRELMGQSYGRHNNTALLNNMIGGALLFAWLSQIIGALMWVPAIGLLGFATPLAVGRASVYSTYMQMGRRAFGGLRQAAGRAVSRWNN